MFKNFFNKKKPVYGVVIPDANDPDILALRYITTHREKWTRLGTPEKEMARYDVWLSQALKDKRTLRYEMRDILRILVPDVYPAGYKIDIPNPIEQGDYLEDGALNVEKFIPPTLNPSQAAIMLQEIIDDKSAIVKPIFDALAEKAIFSDRKMSLELINMLRENGYEPQYP